MITKAVDKSANQNRKKILKKKRKVLQAFQQLNYKRARNQSGFTLLTTVGGRRQ